MLKKTIFEMKYVIVILAFLNLNSCTDTSRSYKERNRKENFPEKLYEGQNLDIAKAIYDGDENKVADLIEIDKAAINTIDGKGEITFLSYAIMMEDLPVMEKLLELGADPDLASPNHLKTTTPLAAVAQRHNIKMLDLLFKYKVDPNPQIGQLPMHVALLGDDEKTIIDYLIDHGADVNLQGFIDGRTVIQTSLNISKIKFINYFLDKGANPLLVSSNGTSLAYDVQEEINNGRLTENGLKDFTNLKERLSNDFNVKFPVIQQKRKGLENAIKRYENLSTMNKKLLGNLGLEIYESDKVNLSKGVNGMGDSLDN